MRVKNGSFPRVRYTYVLLRGSTQSDDKLTMCSLNISVHNLVMYVQTSRTSSFVNQKTHRFSDSLPKGVALFH